MLFIFFAALIFWFAFCFYDYDDNILGHNALKECIMTNKYRFLPVLLILTAALIFTACGTGTNSLMTVAEEEAYKNYVLSSYFMLRGDVKLADSRTAWDYTETVTLPDAGETSTATSNNYPEKGQKTTVTISTTSEANVYFVSNITTYPNRDSISTTEENYYIKDDGSGKYDTADLICEADGTVNAFYRETFRTTFDDGTTREEQIDALYGDADNPISYAEFAIDGDLTFPEANNDDDTWSPTEGDADWSSMVSYEQTEGNAYSLWNTYKNIMGVRYYTEQGDVRTSVTYERMITRDTDALSTRDNLVAFLRRVFSRDPDSNTVYPGETLTETVIRKKISGNKKTQIETSSTVFDSNGGSVVTFTASYETADDGTVISDGVPVASPY